MKKLSLLMITLFLVKGSSIAQLTGVPVIEIVSNINLHDDIILRSLEIIEHGQRASGLSGNSLGNPTGTLNLNECVPDFSQDLSSDITVSCNGEPTCETCFNTAFDRLNFYRRQLGRMRCIYNSTKTYKDNALAMGDNMSGIHAMAGIAWQKERTKIVASFENTKTIYDRRSAEFLEGLQTTLRELNTCMYIAGENNWYTKSGFIYFEFMQERYKRND